MQGLATLMVIVFDVQSVRTNSGEEDGDNVVDIITVSGSKYAQMVSFVNPGGTVMECPDITVEKSTSAHD